MKLLAPLLFLSLSRQEALAATDKIFPIGNTRPEGILAIKNGTVFGLADDSPWLLYSEQFYGGVNAINMETGQITPIISTQDTFNEQQALGLAYADGILLVAGGQVNPSLRMYNASTGELMAECKSERDDGYMNDVIVIQDSAYVTDSLYNSIYKFALELTPEGNCTLQETIATPEDPFLIQLDTGFPYWGANGLVPYESGVLVVAETAGSLWFIDLENGNEASEVLPPGFLPFGGGMTITKDGVLFVTSIAYSKIMVYQVSIQNGFVAAEMLGELGSENLDSPSTVALLNSTIYAANNRITNLHGSEDGSPALDEDDRDVFTEQFNVVGLDASEYVRNSDGVSAGGGDGNLGGSPAAEGPGGDDSRGNIQGGVILALFLGGIAMLM